MTTNDGWQATRYPNPFRLHQERALAALAEAHAAGSRRSWVVLPPGAGKTVVGLEAARRLGRPIVAFGPNTAIQGQWLTEWARFAPATLPGSADRALSAPVTSLTYQSLAVFDPDAEVDEEGRGAGRSGLLDRLHDNGRALITALGDAGPITLILDECHHLLEVWGRLLAGVLDRLPDATVIGLTGTPPGSLTADEAALVEELFGDPLYQTSIPSVVRAGHLAPYTELAWFTPPTTAESDWLAGEAERFAELQTDLLADHGGPVAFLDWLDRRFVSRRATPEDGPGPILDWARLERTDPDLAGAAMRFHHAGLLALPPGAVLREEHQHRPSAQDWAELLGDFVTGRLLPSTDRADEHLLDSIRAALPSVGYQLTRRGIRRGRSPVDRVIARSEAKTGAAAEILAAEHAQLGDRLRALILTDHERATATLPARLRDVISPEAGSARLLLANLITDPRTAVLEPIMITGSTVAAAPETATKIIEYVHRVRPDLALSPQPTEDGRLTLITGGWRSRDWVALLTGYLEAGHTRALVGTRALLGEGWDARTVNTLIDLTTATTSTAVVQTRGRALRLDPAWPDKVADLWTVVCVSHDHPGGLGDWDRFVRKHEGYFGVTETGDITSGVSHVDPLLSPYEPPAGDTFDKLNARMLTRAEDRAGIRDLWRIGADSADELVHAVWLTRRAGAHDQHQLGAGDGSPATIPAADPPDLVPGPLGPVGHRPVRPNPVPPGVIMLAAIGLAVPAALSLSWPLAIIALVLLGLGGIVWWHGRRTTRLAAGRRLAAMAPEPDPVGFGFVIADAMRAAGLIEVGPEAVRATVDADGTYRILLDGVAEESSKIFATALDELLAPIGSPRYLVPRYLPAEVGTDPSDLREAGRSWIAGTMITDEVVYHPVPAIFGVNAGRLGAFLPAWHRWISGGEPIRSHTPEGEGILITHRGRSPFDVATRLRVSWH